MTTPAQQDPMVQNLLQQNRDTLDRREPGQQEDQQQPTSSTRDRNRDDARDSSDDVAPVPAAAPVDHSDSPYGAAAWRERIQSPEYQRLQRELYRRERGMGPDASGWRYTEDVTGEGYGEGVYRVTEEGHEVTGLPRPQYRPTAGERQILHRYQVTGGGDPTEEIDPTGFGLRGDRLPGFGKRDYIFEKPEPGPGDPSQASPDMGIDYYGGVFSAESPVDAFSQPEDRRPTTELQGQPDLGVAARTRFAEVAPNLGDLLPDDPTGDYSTDTGGHRRSTSSEIAPNWVDSFRAGPVTFSTRGDPHEPGYQLGPTTSQALTVADRGDIQDLGTAHHSITPITVEDRPPHAFPVEALQDQADYLEPPLWLWSPDQAYMHGDAQRWEVAPNSGLVVPVAQAVPTPGYTRGPIEGVDIPLDPDREPWRPDGFRHIAAAYDGRSEWNRALGEQSWEAFRKHGRLGFDTIPAAANPWGPMALTPGQLDEVVKQYEDRYRVYLGDHITGYGSLALAAHYSEDGYTVPELIDLGLSVVPDVLDIGGWAYRLFKGTHIAPNTFTDPMPTVRIAPNTFTDPMPPTEPETPPPPEPDITSTPPGGAAPQADEDITFSPVTKTTPSGGAAPQADEDITFSPVTRTTPTGGAAPQADEDTPTTPTTPPNTPRIDLSSRRPKPPSPRARIRLPRPGPNPGRSREAPRTRGNQPHIVEWVSHSLNRLDLRTGEHASRPASNTNVNTFRITRKGAESTAGKQYRAANLEIESSRDRAHATPVPGRKRRRSRRSRRDEADQAFPGTLTFVPRENNRRR